tara:strand:- start:395 stop:655 length:261 start_codon:yes stop_codon:yes gene_type:complete
VTSSDFLAKKNRFFKIPEAQNFSLFIFNFNHIERGEIFLYTKFVGEMSERSTDRLTAEAKRMRANSLAETRFTTSMVMSEAAEHAA